MWGVRFSAAVLLAALSIAAVYAQDECSALATEAIIRANAACAQISSNEACYGYSAVEAEFQPLIDPIPFDEAGHLAAITDILTLQTLPLTPQLNEWGIALLHVQPNLPDVLPGQHVTFLLFGSAELQRSDSDDNTPQEPMRVFRLETGIVQTRCRELSSDGLIIQTPRGAGDIAFTINGVNVNVGSTIWFEAQPEGAMIVRTLEGSAEVEVDGVVQIADEGTFVSVPMDEDLEPDGPPEEPEAFVIEEDEWLLPLEMLDEEITLDTLMDNSVTDDSTGTNASSSSDSDDDNSDDTETGDEQAPPDGDGGGEDGG
ncbi:MAG: hypothetical protein SF123_02110 [Chloroflexota bacterium]|nr:hypothetical protein [Chloroflexota bacterium]